MASLKTLAFNSIDCLQASDQHVNRAASGAGITSAAGCGSAASPDLLMQEVISYLIHNRIWASDQSGICCSHQSSPFRVVVV